MTAKDRLYERRFAKLIAQLPTPDRRKVQCRVVDGRLYRARASHSTTPVGRKINALVTMRARARSDW